jgi:hypothetical protein
MSDQMSVLEDEDAIEWICFSYLFTGVRRQSELTPEYAQQEGKPEAYLEYKACQRLE